MSLHNVTPGEKAPEFKGLTGVDGKQYSLADMKDAKAVVVCFTCNACPAITPPIRAYVAPGPARRLALAVATAGKGRLVRRLNRKRMPDMGNYSPKPPTGMRPGGLQVH